MDIDWIVTLWSALVVLVATTVQHRNEKMHIDSVKDWPVLAPRYVNRLVAIGLRLIDSKKVNG